MNVSTAVTMQAPTVLSPCCSIDPNYGRILWAINNEDEPVILETYKIQTWFDQKYNISHEIDDLKFNDN